MRLAIAICATLLLANGNSASPVPVQEQQAPPNTAERKPSFESLDQWLRAIREADKDAFTQLYATSPAPEIQAEGKPADVHAEAGFWTSLRPAQAKLELLASQSPQPHVQTFVFRLELLRVGSTRPSTQYVNVSLVWVETGGNQWHIAASQRTGLTRLKQPVSTSANLYPAGVDANASIRNALTQAVKEHKRMLLVFGANWCYDCHVLHEAFERDDIAPLLRSNFLVVPVDIGRGDKNQDLMKRYEVPMEKGIPALAVLEADGKLLYSQRGGEFESARSLAPDDIIGFLNRWKPSKTARQE